MAIRERETGALREGFLSSLKQATTSSGSPQHAVTKGLEPMGLEPLPKEGIASGSNLPDMMISSPEEQNIPNFSHVISSFSYIYLGTSSIPVPPILPNVSATIPDPLNENPSIVASKDSRTLSSEDVLIRYNLRNHSVPTVGRKEAIPGLGVLRMGHNPEKRRRKSNLNLAQARAKHDIAWTSGALHNTQQQKV